MLELFTILLLLLVIVTGLLGWQNRGRKRGTAQSYASVVSLVVAVSIMGAIS